MTLSALIRKRDTGNLATAIPAISATQPKGEAATVARIATVAVANPKEEKAAPPAKVGAGGTAPDIEQPFFNGDKPATNNKWLENGDRPRASVAGDKQGAAPVTTGTKQAIDPEAWEERAAICEFDGGLSREDAEAIAWLEDDRRRCRHCLNLLPNGICKVASPKGPVVANRGYRPVDILKRCEGYRPCLDDPDRRNGLERWWPRQANEWIS